MSQNGRIPIGGLLNRSRPLSFRFNGKQYVGYEGDTLASALLANNVKVVSRSFKFHRPRGILSAGVEEPNALLSVDTGSGLYPVSRATLVPLVDGLIAETQNCFPSVDFDVGRVFDYTRRLWPAGFYNKTFKWPSWHTYEWAIRRLAGLGRVPHGPDPTRYLQRNAHCDVLVAGGGLAGLHAAISCARKGRDVVLVEQEPQLGGRARYESLYLAGDRPKTLLDERLSELKELSNVRVMLDSTVSGVYDSNVLSVHDRSRYWGCTKPVEQFWKIRAESVVIATGAIEQPLVFANNDLPGIMLADAVQRYFLQYAVRVGRSVVGLVNNDRAWRSLLSSRAAGLPVTSIVDVRAAVDNSLLARAANLDIEVFVNATPLAARGSKAVRSFEFQRRDGRTWELKCDVIAMSGGLNPTTHLYSQAGGTLGYNPVSACFLPARDIHNVDVIGDANGGFATEAPYNISAPAPAPVSFDAQWVDYLHDVTVADIALAMRENFVSVEHMKRYTTVGMAVDQGKTSNLNALTIAGLLTDRAPGEVGTTTFRPQFMPVTMGAIAGSRRGNLYAPGRRLAAHTWHAAQGAMFDDYGEWQRPAYYGENREEAILAEVKATRETAGIFDGSPLGKIEVKGPDAADFLNRMYLNTVDTLAIGKVRYGLMLNENGVVIDDGVFARLSDDHFLVNTSSGAAERIAAWLEEWHQCEWPDMQVLIAPVTSSWAVISVAGPQSRAILQQLPGMVDLRNESFPHMSFSQSRLDDGTRYRIQRVSYTGEVGYELSVPSRQAAGMLSRIDRIARAVGARPIGVEALLILRLEKGFLHVGVDTDGSTNALDVGFGQVVRKKTGNYVGARSLQRKSDQSPRRRQIVGIEAESGTAIRPGAHFVVKHNGKWQSEGYVTSACRSPTLGKTIGLGLLESGASRIGEDVLVYDNSQVVKARVVERSFYDPAGERMRG